MSSVLSRVAVKVVPRLMRPTAGVRCVRTLPIARSTKQKESMNDEIEQQEGSEPTGRKAMAARVELESLQAKALDQAMLYIDRYVDVPKTYFASQMQYYAGTADLSSDEIARNIAYQNYVTRRRPYIIRSAEKRSIFVDLFPSDLRNIKADIIVRTQPDKVLRDIGTIVEPKEFIQHPDHSFRVFHKETILYTYLFLDADRVYPASSVTGAPAEQRDYILHAVVDIPLQAGANSGANYEALARGREVLSYERPHPTRGTKYHRLVSVLLEQPAALGELEIVRSARVWDLVRKLQLRPRGVHCLRSAWDESVTEYFRDVLGQHEPSYVDMTSNRAAKCIARNVYRPL